MINANDSQIKLEKYYADCVKFWTRQNGIDEREAYKRALEYDLIEIFKVNNGCLQDPYSAKGEELDKQTTLNFFKYRCQDLYGRDWEERWKEYNIVQSLDKAVRRINTQLPILLQKARKRI